jgi:hypothetical protein
VIYITQKIKPVRQKKLASFWLARAGVGASARSYGKTEPFEKCTLLLSQFGRDFCHQRKKQKKEIMNRTILAPYRCIRNDVGV